METQFNFDQIWQSLIWCDGSHIVLLTSICCLKLNISKLRVITVLILPYIFFKCLDCSPSAKVSYRKPEKHLHQRKFWEMIIKTLYCPNTINWFYIFKRQCEGWQKEKSVCRWARGENSDVNRKINLSLSKRKKTRGKSRGAARE